MSLTSRLCRSLLVFATLCAPGLFAAAAPGEANQAVSHPSASASPQIADWRLVAESHFIVKGQLVVPVAAIQRSLRSKKYSYLALQLRVHTAIKGHLNRKVLTVRFYTAPSKTEPAARTLFALHNHEVLAHLIQTDDSGPELYFAGYTPTAVQPFEAAIAARVQREVLNQERIVQESIVAAFATSQAARPDPLDAKVKSLIAAMLDARTEETAFEQLMALGTAAVPATIRLMDDRRVLPIQRISVRNTSPDRFEEFAQYGPRVVVDALAIILSSSTHESFGFIGNGGSEQERRAEINAWRIYLHYLRPSKAV